MTLTRPDLHVAVAGQKSKASEYNENFEMMLDYCDDVVEECEEKKQELIDTAETYMPTLSAGAMYSDGSSSYYSAGEHFAINKGADPLLNAPGSGTVEQLWAQPTLSANGTMGGDDFACSGSAFANENPAYQAFDSDSATGFSQFGTASLIFYIPKAVKLQSLVFSAAATQVTLYLSSDGTNWTSYGVITSGQNLNIQTEYQYYRLDATGTGAYYNEDYGWRIYIRNVVINAKYTVSVSTANTLYFNVNETEKLTLTNILGKSNIVKAYNPINVSSKANGTYKIALPFNDVSPYLVSDAQLFVQSSIPYKEYTIFGSPTILSNVISGFSSANYLTLNNPFNPDSRNWKISITFTVGTDITTSQVLYSDGVQDTSMAMELGIDGGYFKYSLSSNGTSYDIADNVSAFVLTASKTYIVELSFNGTGYNIKYTIDNGDTWGNGTGTTSSSILYTAPTSYIGCRRATDKPFLGSINWENTEFRVKDNIHITPQKPHTAFKDTLTDREAFSDVIPVGAQITVASGLITKISQPYYNANSLEHKIIDFYKNGTSFYEIITTPNGIYCRQGGNGSAITLLKEFKDTNYLVTSSATASSKAVGSFTLSTTADWIAEGYIL